MDIKQIWVWFQMGFFGGLGFLTISLLWGLIVKR